jgi:hypothetical protein
MNAADSCFDAIEAASSHACGRGMRSIKIQGVPVQGKFGRLHSESPPD